MQSGPVGIGTGIIDRVGPGLDIQIVPELFDVVGLIGSTVEDEFTVDAADVAVRVQFNGYRFSALRCQNQIQCDADAVGLGLIAQEFRILEQNPDLFQPVKVRGGDQGLAVKFQNCPGGVSGS